jgi:hypothetical protein
MRRRRSLRTLALASLACGAWLGCNAILGNESAEFDPEAAARLDGSSGGEGSSSGDGSGDGTSNADGSSSGGDASLDGDADAGECFGVDFTTSADHCGACGHSCRGGECAASKCKPIVLATDEVGPGPITIDATHVYWINVKTGDVFSVPIAGGAKVRLFDGATDTGGRNIVVHDGGVYFGIADVDAGVVRCNAPTCDAGPTYEVPSLDVPSSIAITDAGALYFVESVSGGGIQRCQLPCGSGRDTIVPSGGGSGFPDNVAVLASDVYWTTITPFPPRLRKLDNGAPVALASGAIENILPTPSEVFFMEQGEGPSAISVDGGAVRRLNALLSSGNMVFFGSGVLATELNAGYVYTCPLAGCPDGGSVVATANKPRGIAFDATYIYWANEGTAGTGGSIMRLAR